MKKWTLLAILFCACGITTITEVEGYCSRCIEARENNARNVNEYFYYEDYLNSQKQ